MMKKLFVIIFLIAVNFSCNEALELSPLDKISEDAVWNDESLVKAYVNGLYNGIPHGLGRHMHSKYSDEAFGDDAMQQGTFTADNVWIFGGGDANHLYFWDQAFPYIRKINLFLEKVAGTPLTEPDKKVLVAEATFLRAQIYFEFIRRFGGVPIMTKTMSLDDALSTKLTRNTFEECVNFIDKDITDAIAGLPEKYAAGNANFGRASQHVALALRSRLWLYAASPLFNGGSIATDASLKAITGFPIYDKARWQKASDAAKAVIDLNSYTLFANYHDLFTSSVGNSEVIFARTWSPTNFQQSTPINLPGGFGGYGGWSGRNCPTQGLVDAFETTKGLPITDPASGFDAANPFNNRDPRLDASILRDGLTFRGRVFESWISTNTSGPNGRDARTNGGDYSRTSYNLRKFMNETLPVNFSQPYNEEWVVYRLGEIYLNYAEAQFELGNEDVAREYLSKIRVRAGMPAILASLSGAALKEKIVNERRVELVFEGHRYFDVRRWKIAMVTENKPITGVDIMKDPTTGAKQYIPTQLTKRTFVERMYLLPIFRTELTRSGGSLVQNPGWE